MPTTVRLSETDRARVRHHLGYPNVEPSSSIALGFPAVGESMFLVERAMDRVVPEGVGQILRALAALDAVESKMIEDLDLLSVQQLGELKIRGGNDERSGNDLLEREYVRWARRLADDLGAPLNPFCERFGGGGSVNHPVATGF